MSPEPGRAAQVAWALALAAVAFLVPWAVLAFVCWEPSVAAWHWAARAVLTLWVAFLAVVIIAALHQD